MAAYWFKTIWLPTYFTEIRGLPQGEAQRLFFTDQIGSVIGYVAFGFAADYFGRRPSFAFFSVMKALGMVMITVWWDTAVQYPGMLIGFMFLVGLGEGNWGCMGPLISELYPTSVRSAALGIIYNVARGVQFLAPVVIAWVAVHSSFGAGIALAAPFALLAGLTVWALPETKGVRLRAS
jgi:MFS family permease